MKGRQPRPFNYIALVGVAFLIVVLLALVNMLRTTDSGTVGLGDVGIGEKAAPFAVPVATSELEGDANVDPDRACSVAGEDVLRICDYFDQPLVMSFWFTRGGDSCVKNQDVFEQVAKRYGDRVGFVSIDVRDDRQKVEELIEERGWDLPVGHDRDGAVSNLYRVGVCPTFLFFEEGGVMVAAETGPKNDEELAAQVRSLVNGQQEGDETEIPAGGGD